MKFVGLRAFAEYSRENVIAGLIWGAVVAFLGAFVLLWPRAFVGQFLIQKSYHLPFIVRDYVLKRHIAITNVVIAYMDDESHNFLQQDPMQGWDRKLHADFIRRLHEEGARAVVFDIVFDQSRPADDPIFAAALAKMKNVVLAADHTPQREAGEGGRILIPTDALLEAIINQDIASQVDDMTALKRHIGIDQVDNDSDLAIRRQLPFNIESAQFYPLSWAAASLVDAPVTQDTNGWKNEFWINYYGPPREVITRFSYWRLIDTNAAQAIPPGFFKDKVVFIGADLMTGVSGQRKDSYKSIYPKKVKEAGIYETPLIPGVEVQATMFLNLVREDWLTKVTLANEVYLALSMGFLSSLILMLLRPLRALLFGVGFIFLIASLAIFSSIYLHLWYSWAVPVMQVAIGTLGSVGYNGYRLQMHRKLLQQSVSMYVSPAVAAEVIAKPEMMQRGARKELLSIMFTDIADFTKMSEGMEWDTLAHLMNAYFETAVTKCVYPTQGTVVKFIGDAIFAIWNAPIAQANHRELACRTAIMLRDQVTDFEFSKPGQQVLTRIGLHTGVAGVGNFGSSQRVDYTAFGDNINLTSRMEGLNKYLGTRILATGDIIEPIPDKFTTRFLGAFQLKGFAKAVNVYEVIGELDRMAPTEALRMEFATGLDAFKKRDFDAAELSFKRVLQMNPKDGPSKFYLIHINEYRVNPPAESWKGEIELKEK